MYVKNYVFKLQHYTKYYFFEVNSIAGSNCWGISSSFLLLLRWHHSPMRTFASLMDLSQSAVFWVLFPGNWLLGHSFSGQMKPNHCPWNFRHLTWRLFYYSPAERDWFYQYSLFGVFIILRGKSRRKKWVFLYSGVGKRLKILCIRTPNCYTNRFYSAFFILQGQVFWY